MDAVIRFLDEFEDLFITATIRIRRSLARKPRERRRRCRLAEK